MKMIRKFTYDLIFSLETRVSNTIEAFHDVVENALFSALDVVRKIVDIFIDALFNDIPQKANEIFFDAVRTAATLVVGPQDVEDFISDESTE